MKTFLVLFVLLFSSSVFSDDISDFQIEGMSVEKSLLDYMFEEEIKTEIKENRYMYAYLNEDFGEAYLYDGLQTYEFCHFSLKLMMKNL